MENYWIPGVNNLDHYGRWSFAEFTQVYEIESDFEAKVQAEFDTMISSTMGFDGIEEERSLGKDTIKKTVETIRHEEATRKNIPTAEYQSVMNKDEQNPIPVAYARRNCELDPQLVWRGKDEQEWSDLVVQAPPLYIQEKVHPKVLIDDLQRHYEQREKADSYQADLFADFNGLPDDNAKTEFYKHDANWTNRMILGDSLQVMASLAEREGLRGKV